MVKKIINESAINFRKDKALVLEIIKNWGGSTFKYASPQLQNDSNFILEIIDAILKDENEHNERRNLEYERRANEFDWEEHMGANFDLDGDPGPDPSVLKREKYENEESDRWNEIEDNARMEDDIERSINFLEHVSPELWSDKAFVLEVVARWPQVIEFALPEMRADLEKMSREQGNLQYGPFEDLGSDDVIMK